MPDGIVGPQRERTPARAGIVDYIVDTSASLPVIDPPPHPLVRLPGETVREHRRRREQWKKSTSRSQRRQELGII